MGGNVLGNRFKNLSADVIFCDWVNVFLRGG